MNTEIWAKEFLKHLGDKEKKMCYNKSREILLLLQNENNNVKINNVKINLKNKKDFSKIKKNFFRKVF